MFEMCFIIFMVVFLVVCENQSPPALFVLPDTVKLNNAGV